MNKILKFGIAAVSLSVAASVFAEEEAEELEGAVGWTPVDVSLASPVQIPWGCATWDVFGLDLGLFYTDTPKMYGLGVCGGAARIRNNLKGVQVTGLCNWNEADVYGLRATLGANLSFASTYGMDIGGFAYREGEFWGIDMELIGSYQRDFWGAQFSGLVNFTDGQSYGLTTSIGGNIALKAYGLQLAGVFNQTDELHGCQIGLINFARECPWGFQIGLVNIIMDNKVKVLPFLNCYF